jgi:sarcosine reductase
VNGLRLEVGSILIKDVQFGSKTEVNDGVLFVNKEELARIAGDDEHIASVEVYLAKPGDQTRIIPVKDVIEPRVKVSGNGGGLPWLDQQSGYGR